MSLADARPAGPSPGALTVSGKDAGAGDLANMPVSAAELSLLQDLRKRRGELDGRAEALEAREALLAGAEKRLAARLDELTTLQKRLEALDAARRDRDEASWQSLTRVYAAMKPKDAAVIFNELEMSVLLPIADRLADINIAPILAAMNPVRARDVTSGLSQLRARANALADATAASVAVPAGGAPSQGSPRGASQAPPLGGAPLPATSPQNAASTPQAVPVSGAPK